MEDDVRDVDEAIRRVQQAWSHGAALSEDELVQAADLLGSHLDRPEAREAATAVRYWMGTIDGAGSTTAPDAGAVGPAPDVPAPPGAGRRLLPVGALVRATGAVLLAGLAVVLWFVMAPEEMDDSTAELAAALAEYEANQARADGAMQQQVVNGWVAKDLLAIVAEQANDSARADRQAEDRLAAEAVVAVVALAFGIATRPSGGRQVS
jgi:hypothetical protein